MKKKILSHTSVMIILTVILTFIAASFVCMISIIVP